MSHHNSFIDLGIAILGVSTSFGGVSPSVFAQTSQMHISRVVQEAESITSPCDTSSQKFNQLSNRANRTYAESKYQHAEQIWRQILEECSGSEAAYLGLGSALSIQGWEQEAKLAYEEAIKINPQSAKAYKLLGDVLRRLEMYDKAIEAHRRAIEIYPSYVSAYLSLGHDLYWSDNFSEAIKAYENAIAIDRNYVYAYASIGNVLRRQGKLDEAVDFYRRSTEIQPQYVWSYIRWGQVLSEQERLSEAIEVYTRAREISADTCTERDLLYSLGDAYRKSAKLREAQEVYDSALQKARTCRDKILIQDSRYFPPTSLFFQDYVNILKKYKNLEFSTSVSWSSQDGYQRSANRIVEDEKKLAFHEISTLAFPLLTVTSPHPLVRLDEIDVGKFRNLAQKYPEISEAYSVLGLALFITGQSGEAIEAFNQAIIKNKPNKQLSNFQLSITSLLGSLLIADGQRDAVISIMDKAIEANPRNALNYFSLISTLNSLDRDVESRHIFNHLQNNYSDISEVFQVLLLIELFELSMRKNYQGIIDLVHKKENELRKIFSEKEANSISTIWLSHAYRMIEISKSDRLETLRINLKPGEALLIPSEAQTPMDNNGEIDENEVTVVDSRKLIVQLFSGIFNRDSELIRENPFFSGGLIFPDSGFSLSAEQIEQLLNIFSNSEIGSVIYNNPQFRSLSNNQIAAFLEIMQPEAAAEVLNNIKEVDPNNPTLSLFQARIELNRENRKDATDLLEQASSGLRENPLSPILAQSLMSLVEESYKGTNIHPAQENIPDTPEVRLNRSIVAVLPGSEIENQPNKQGTGVVVERRGNVLYILTARHLLEENSSISQDVRVEFYSEPQPNQQRLRLYAEVEPQSITNPELDLVLLKVVGGVPEDIQPLNMASTAQNLGESLLVIGHPHSDTTDSWRETTAVFKGTSAEGYSEFQIALPEFSETRKTQGYSGAPVLNANREGVGILYSTDRSLYSVYSLDKIRTVLQQWR
ncbi:MAG: tetratricopeptide repeat protein [Symploca sp. SIO2D2]|nr:tetratricopeptide repeat protein [Symploca sp. SIO2D2]